MDVKWEPWFEVLRLTTEASLRKVQALQAVLETSNRECSRLIEKPSAILWHTPARGRLVIDHASRTSCLWKGFNIAA